jgi:type II secretory pathway pseudopilin PulG
MFDITVIIEAVIALIGVIITAIVIPYIRSKTTVAQQQQINNWVKIAVAAAEQIYLGTGRGTEKKAHVIAFLNSKGVTLDVESVDAMIESAVYELTHGLIDVGEAVEVVEK